jgi:hypothetical protein
MPNRCVYFCFKPYSDSFFLTSTQRSPFSAGITTQPIRATVPTSHPHPDVSPESGHPYARDEDAKDKREAKPEGYEAPMFNI